MPVSLPDPIQSSQIYFTDKPAGENDQSECEPDVDVSTLSVHLQLLHVLIKVSTHGQVRTRDTDYVAKIDFIVKIEVQVP